jgi:hypothetical protein
MPPLLRPGSATNNFEAELEGRQSENKWRSSSCRLIRLGVCLVQRNAFDDHIIEISYKRKMIHQNLESSCEKQLSPGGAPLFWRVLFVVGRNTFLQYRVSVQAVSFEAPHCALEHVYVATRMATSVPGSANHALFWLTLQLMSWRLKSVASI